MCDRRILLLKMFNTETLEQIWCTARKCDPVFPITYSHLFGAERLAILPLLQEPLQSTLHQIMQQKIDPQTNCAYKHCDGILNKVGHCSNQCEQSGINVVHDIMCCLNCDTYGFPCPTCTVEVFHNQLKRELEDY